MLYCPEKVYEMAESRDLGFSFPKRVEECRLMVEVE